MPSALEESVPETDWHVIPGCHGFESHPLTKKILALADNPGMAVFSP